MDILRKDDDDDDDNNNTGKARYQGTTENSYIGHNTHTAESANVEAQTGLILKTALYAPLTVRAE
jgi:hypothetical protein